MLDFLYDLFSPRKSAAIITRNKVLEEVEEHIKQSTMFVTKELIDADDITKEFIRGYELSSDNALTIIEGLKK